MYPANTAERSKVEVWAANGSFVYPRGSGVPWEVVRPLRSVRGGGGVMFRRLLVVVSSVLRIRCGCDAGEASTVSTRVETTHTLRLSHMHYAAHENSTH